MKNFTERFSLVVLGFAIASLCCFLMGAMTPQEKTPNRTADLNFVMGGIGGAMIVVNDPGANKTFLYALEAKKQQPQNADNLNPDQMKPDPRPRLVATIDLATAGEEKLGGDFIEFN